MQRWTLSGPLEYNDPLAGTCRRGHRAVESAIDTATPAIRSAPPSRSDIEPSTSRYRMTHQHPDLADEQAYIDHAYECLESSRKAAWRLRDLSEADLGGTFQARFERNAFDEALVKRLTDLDLGDAALVFGRIDRAAEIARHARELPHRPARRRRREARPGRRRLAGAGGGAVLPGHRARADGARAAPALRGRGPHACSASKTSCSAPDTSASATTRGSSTTTADGSTRRRPSSAATAR